MVFFFQAEDGIRDGHVTGVQTCALPIFIAGIVIMRILHNSIDKYRRELALFDTMGIALFTVLGTAKTLDLGFHPRSEERRVGKDYRSRCRCVSTKQELSAYTTRTSELTD